MVPRTDKHLDEQRLPVGLHHSDESISDESIELDRLVDVTCDDHTGRADLAMTEGWDVPARRVRELVATLDARSGHPRLGELIAWRGITARASVLLAPGVDELRAMRYLEATQHIARRMNQNTNSGQIAALLNEQPDHWIEAAASLGRPDSGEPLARVPGTTAVWSPDGTRLATGSDDGTVIVWRVDGDGSASHAASLTGHTDEVLSLDPPCR